MPKLPFTTVRSTGAPRRRRRPLSRQFCQSTVSQIVIVATMFYTQLYTSMTFLCIPSSISSSSLHTPYMQIVYICFGARPLWNEQRIKQQQQQHIRHWKREAVVCAKCVLEIQFIFAHRIESPMSERKKKTYEYRNKFDDLYGHRGHVCLSVRCNFFVVIQFWQEWQDGKNAKTLCFSFVRRRWRISHRSLLRDPTRSFQKDAAFEECLHRKSIRSAELWRVCFTSALL